MHPLLPYKGLGKSILVLFKILSAYSEKLVYFIFLQNDIEDGLFRLFPCILDVIKLQ